MTKFNKGRYYNETRQSVISKDIRERNRFDIHDRDQNIFDQGRWWFKNGLSLSDAPDEMRQNQNFINGFRREERLFIVNRELYNLGVEFAQKGIIVTNVPDKYRSNEIFMKGYEEATKGIVHKK